MMIYPYDIFESLFGAYDPMVPRKEIFSVWLSEKRSEFYAEHPEEMKNQIDGHMYEDARNRFFKWLSDKYCDHKSTTFGNCNNCGKEGVFGKIARGLTRPEHKPLDHNWFKSS